jgi:3-carboxy-cis,cis-muconate cycloisomerase
VIPFSAIFVPEELADAVSDRSWLGAMLDAECALARAQGRAGVLTEEAATAVADACDPSLYDVTELAVQGRTTGNPAEPLVRALRARIGEPHAGAVHLGATSQDIVDSAAMVVAQRASKLVDDELAGAAEECARLAAEHRHSVMAARTLLQQAVPTTFGLKAAGWLVGLVEARARLAAVVASLPAQLGGAAGTLAALGGDGIGVLHLYAEELGLREPVVPWHTIRTPVTELAGALAGVAGAAAKIGTDIVLLAQTEVREVAERAPGGSSTMPHKRNPVGAVLAVACERHARANAEILIEGVVQEHERAAGAWQAEWPALTTALAAAGGAVASVRRSLTGLEVDVDRMRANIEPETLAEAVRLGIPADRPEDYLGSVDAFVDRALALHRG